MGGTGSVGLGGYAALSPPCSSRLTTFQRIKGQGNEGAIMVITYSIEVKWEAVASWLVCSSPDRAVRVRALAGDIVLCSQAQCLSPTQVYKWVSTNLMLRDATAWWAVSYADFTYRSILRTE